MLVRSVLVAVVILATAAQALGQAPAARGEEETSLPAWRRAGEPTAGADGVRTAAVGGTDRVGRSGEALPASSDTPASGRIARVTSGPGTLPNQHGQVWREYDVSPYTLRVTTTERPEQAIIDWVLRETGYEAWHREPLGILSATQRTLRVYHTPEMQAVVADLVDRFVSSEAQTHTFALRVVTVAHPNWRARAQRLMHPVAVQTPGASAWLLQKEDAAMLLAELRRRNDYREHSSPHLMVNNGQSTVVSALRGRSYIRDAAMRADVWPGFEAELGEVEEGYSLEFCPLLSLDRKMIDASIQCNIDQVEKMIQVMIDVPTQAAPRQRTKIEVPQMTQVRFHERFRWPIDQVLLVGMGVVALPVPVDSRPLIAGLPLPIGNSPPRADLLVFVESKGKAVQDPRMTRSPRGDNKSYRGRY